MNYSLVERVYLHVLHVLTQAFKHTCLGVVLPVAYPRYGHPEEFFG